MATVGNQQSWLPYDGNNNNNGCSQSFCSIYCPQWCYVFFPPPPPPSLPVSHDESGAALSPTVITVIILLSTALLLISYYIFVSNSFRHHRFPVEEPAVGQDERQALQNRGLDEALINTVWKYKRENRVGSVTDCSVCLGEFKEEEIIRLLPNCSHAFHLPCIDTWLKSHPNCPLCRDNVMIAAAFPAEPEHEIVLEIEEAERSGGDEEGGGNGAVVVEIGEEDDAEQESLSLSMTSYHERRASIADATQARMEEEYIVGKESRSWRRSGREQSRGGGRNRGLHCVMIPVRMKRFVSGLSGGRLVLNRGERGRTSHLQV